MNQLLKHQSAYKRQKIENMLAQRIKKLGSIKTDDAWHICREHYPYGVIAFHFRCIMIELREKGKADFIRKGLWFIHKN